MDNLDKLPEQQSAAGFLPLDEMEERLEIINELEKNWRLHFAWLTQKPKEVSRDFNHVEFSALLHMDTDYLQYRIRSIDDSDGLIRTVLCLVFSGWA